jgi:hypothetical protein
MALHRMCYNIQMHPYTLSIPLRFQLIDFSSTSVILYSAEPLSSNREYIFVPP